MSLPSPPGVPQLSIRLRRPDLHRLPRPELPERPSAARSVYFGGHGLIEAKVYDRASLPAGFAADGPAIIEEYGSTSLVWPGDRFAIGDLHEITVECRSAAGVT